MFIGHSMADVQNIRKLIFENKSKVYMIGIGGISMSSLALLLKRTGIDVSGSDREENSNIIDLRSKGIKVNISHKRENILLKMPTIIVYSLSISSDNPEICEAKRLGILCISRAELLGAVALDFRFPVGISGSHGKSTVTAMLYTVIKKCGKHPSLLLGASGENIPKCDLSGNEYLIYESCEYGDSFLRIRPYASIFLNAELDHTDYFSDQKTYLNSFAAAADLTSGFSLINADDENLSSVIPSIAAPVLTFSEKKSADFNYVIKSGSYGKYSFELYRENNSLGIFSLSVPARFNVTNAVAALSSASALGFDLALAKEAIESFSGIGRRLEFIKSIGACHLYYDYAHHPSEISSVYSALSDMGYSRICAIFSPHTYSRTKAFFDSFAAALASFDSVYLTEIFGAREAPIVGVTSSSLSSAIMKLGTFSASMLSPDSFSDFDFDKYDCLVLLGAGDLEKYKRKLEEL